MKRIIAILALAVTPIACGDATSDLPKTNQDVTDRDVDVYRMPDQFPNIAVLCTDEGNGIYSNTRSSGNMMEVVVTDPACEEG